MMKSKITIFFYCLLFAAFVETYFRLQDPVNYLRPTNILIQIDDQMKVFHTKYLLGITKFISGYIMDVIRLSFALLDLGVIKPVAWFVEMVFYNDVSVAIGLMVSIWWRESTLCGKSGELLIITLSVLWIYCLYEESQKITAKKEHTPIYDKMVHEGRMLKLKEAEARLARVKGESDDIFGSTFFDTDEVLKLKTENKRLGKELDRMCALLKKEGVVGTGI